MLCCRLVLSQVYAVDVGTNQPAWKLRQDERVISMNSTISAMLSWEISNLVNQVLHPLTSALPN